MRKVIWAYISAPALKFLCLPNIIRAVLRKKEENGKRKRGGDENTSELEEKEEEQAGAEQCQAQIKLC